MISTVFVVAGTGDSRKPGLPFGALTSVTRQLDTDRFALVWIDYPAAYGNGLSYSDSCAAGRLALKAAIARTSGPFAVVGYSQGADVAGDVAHEIGSGAFTLALTRVVMFGLLSDPSRDQLDGRGGYGITGGRGGFGVIKDRVFQFANPLDPICNAAPGAMIRDLADLTRMMGPDVVRWGGDMLSQLRSQGVQNKWGARSVFDIPRQIARIRACRDDIRRYLPYDLRANPTGGQHAAYGVPIYRGGPSYIDRLVQILELRSPK